MGLKLAVSGKGGVGKTTIAALMARTMAARGSKVIAIDADPVPNLGAALGLPEDALPAPISGMRDLIAERTGAQPGTFGSVFRMNPEVDDIPERFGADAGGVRLLVMGSVDKGGSGCVCPESVLLKALVQHLVLRRDEVVIMDMEAGVEHLGRGTARYVDLLLVVVDPGARSHVAARTIQRLAHDIQVPRVAVVGNRVRDRGDEDAVRAALPGIEIIGFVPVYEALTEADREGRAPFADPADIPAPVKALASALEIMATRS